MKEPRNLIDFERTLRETIIETLLPENSRVVGNVCEDPDLQKRGWWVSIAGDSAFFGKTFAAAIFTARIGDWFIERRDGRLSRSLIEWFEYRARRPGWNAVESEDAARERKERIILNAEWATEDPVVQSEESQIVEEFMDEDPDSLVQGIKADNLPGLKEIEFLEVAGRPGIWEIDGDCEVLSRVRFKIEEGGYLYQLGEKIRAEPGMVLRTFARIRLTESASIVRLELYALGSDKPFLELTGEEDPFKNNSVFFNRLDLS